MCSGKDGQRFKRLPDQIMYGQKYGRKFVKPLRIEKKWAKEKPKLDNAQKLIGIYFIDPDDRDFSEILKNARRKLERSPNCITKVIAKSEIASERNSKTVFGCMVESHESTKTTGGIFSTQKIMKTTLQFGSQIHSDATSDENSGCKSRSGQGMEKVRDNPSMEFG